MKARHFPRTIGSLTLAVTLISGIVTTAVALAATLIMHRELELQLDERIRIETEALVDTYRQDGFDALARVVTLRDQRSGTSDMGYLAGVDEAGRSTAYLLIDAQGHRRAGSLQARIPKTGWSEFVRFRRTDGSRGVAQAMNTRLPDGSQLIVAADRSVIQRMHWMMLRLFGTGWAAILLLSLAATLGFGRVVRRRLDEIGSSAEAIMKGDLSRRMPLDGSGGEFDRLSLVLNRMLDRIGALLENLRQVSGDIAHDLRTPLQRVRNRLEAAASTADSTAHEAPLDAALREMDDVLELFASLLAISEVEGQSVRATFEPLRLDEAVAEIADLYRPTFEDEGRLLGLDLAPVTVRGDRRLLQRVVANLLDNALIHTPSTAAVILVLQIVSGMAVLTISDEGPGIPRSEAERVFRRLTRLDASRSTPGHGLGLSMVAAIVEAHDGAVSIPPSSRGLTVRVALPEDVAPGQEIA